MPAVWLRLLSAIFGGLLLAWAFPVSIEPVPLPEPFGPLPLPVPGMDPRGGFAQLPLVAFIALIPLLEATRLSRRPSEAFLWGYLGGLVWQLLNQLWIGIFGLLPLLLLVGYFALPLGVFCLLAYYLLRTPRPLMLLWGLPALWTGWEYLRSFGVWSYPWSLLGYSQVNLVPLIQVADLGGVFAVSFVVALVNVAIFILLAPVGRFRLRLGTVFLGAGVVFAVLAYGEVLLAWQPYRAPAPTLKLGLVQGGLDCRRRWDDDLLNLTLEHYVPPADAMLTEWKQEQQRRQQERQGLVGPWQPEHMLVMWPETVLPVRGGLDPRRPEKVPFQLMSLLADHDDCALLLGALGKPTDDEHAQNGLLLVEPNERLRWVHSKVRLVPYGEVVPFREVVRFLRYPWGNYDISAGRSVAPFSWQGHTLGGLVCFDNVYGFITRQQTLDGAEALVLATNNSWYKLHSGIRQHCDIDVLRAVECRRPLARVSTTGWSQLVGPDGRVINSTAIAGPGQITAWVPATQGLSPYVLLGDVFAQLCLIIAVLLLLRPVVVGTSEGIL